MNLHINTVLITLQLICILACEKQEQANFSGVQITDAEDSVDESVLATEVSIQETLESFLERVRKASQSDNETDLISIIQFPLIGQGENKKYTETFLNLEDLKSSGRVYAIFKEDLSFAVKIEDSSQSLGPNWYSIKFKEGSYEANHFFELELIDGIFFITKIELPGA